MKLFFQKIGQGRPLIVLHGLYGSSDNWITIGRKLAQNSTVYLVDQRNHGRSPHSPEHSYQSMANDIEELMTSEYITKASILGHSMGGKVAMLFAALHPERVDKLIIVDISPGGYASLTQYSPQVIAHLNIVSAMQSIDFSEVESRADVDKALSQKIVDNNTRQLIMKNLHRNTDNSYSWKINIDAIGNALPGIMASIKLDKINEGKPIVGFPILVIKGGRSDYLMPDQMTLLKKFFPNAQFEIIQNAGHWVHAEQPEKFLEVVKKFLGN